jgi:hypothetical protein
LITVVRQGLANHASNSGIVVDDEDARHTRQNGAVRVPRSGPTG